MLANSGSCFGNILHLKNVNYFAINSEIGYKFYYSSFFTSFELFNSQLTLHAHLNASDKKTVELWSTAHVDLIILAIILQVQ